MNAVNEEPEYFLSQKKSFHSFFVKSVSPER